MLLLALLLLALFVAGVVVAGVVVAGVVVAGVVVAGVVVVGVVVLVVGLLLPCTPLLYHVSSVSPTNSYSSFFFVLLLLTLSPSDAAAAPTHDAAAAAAALLMQLSMPHFVLHRRHTLLLIRTNRRCYSSSSDLLLEPMMQKLFLGFINSIITNAHNFFPEAYYLFTPKKHQVRLLSDVLDRRFRFVHHRYIICSLKFEEFYGNASAVQEINGFTKLIQWRHCREPLLNSHVF